ncbi:hypothetical protein [Chelatococcus sp. YT9]|uniref:hypothetical protein n=1 Tax=Chelatococcus sp. YT9 TaxID=2835635 RepID=UPI001BCF2024|nr:hypothetical protein [Chelatococcus sp. YT9]MBS7696532.1 hypothetical protein [Chelatococcus sp. YT9]
MSTGLKASEGSDIRIFRPTDHRGSIRSLVATRCEALAKAPASAYLHVVSMITLIWSDEPFTPERLSQAKPLLSLKQETRWPVG